MKQLFRKFTLAVGGHRPPKIGGYDRNNPLRRAISAELNNVFETLNPTHAISGMALGADTDFAHIALDRGIPLIAAVPFKGQESKWIEEAQVEYRQILERASKVHYLKHPGYALWKMHNRDRWLVDHCDHLVAVWDGSPSGTGYTVTYAKKRNKPIMIINPLDFDVVGNDFFLDHNDQEF